MTDRWTYSHVSSDEVKVDTRGSLEECLDSLFYDRSMASTLASRGVTHLRLEMTIDV